MNKYAIGLIVVAIIAIFGIFFPQVKNVIVGAVPTLDSVDSPFLSLNGQREWRGTVGMSATSSVVCSIQNGLAATSSIEYVSAEVTSRGGIGSNAIDISTSTSIYATSSPSLVYDYAMGTGQFSIEMAKNTATTSGTLFGAPNRVIIGMTSNGASRYILGPTERIQFVVSTTSPGGGGAFASYMSGKCSVVLKKI